MPLWESNEHKRLRRMAEEVRGSRLLDIGFAQIPNPYLRGTEVVGFDLQARPVSAPYTRTVQGNAAAMKDLLPRGGFDTVLAGEIIEHVCDPYRFLEDCRSLIAPGGRLLISTPNPLHPPILLCEAFGIERFYYTREHLHYFLPRWVRRMLDLSGFSLLKEVSVGFMLPLPGKPSLPCPTLLSYQVIYVAEPREPLS